MPSADDRIVRMEFDNAAFEKKIKSTLDSLAQLDKALKFTGASKGLTDISDATKRISFEGMGNSIEDVSKKFLALSTIAITTLVNITNQALHAGAQIAKAFTIAPIRDGLQEYETQLNSVQTILSNTASKGSTLEQVNDALQKLNEYSDQTIYNFGQMARNIGTFTAAGVELEASVTAIKGIANLAALSGSNADQASTAMYQLSQAIATGSVRLMDWNSVVNAGMGGEVFQNALFETQKVMGNLLNVPVDQTFAQWKDAGNSFRDSLQEGWLTADVLTTTLTNFTGDMTEEMLLQKGFSEQQAQAILETAKIAKAAATEVKTFTQLVGTVKEAVGTGWADSFKIIIGNFHQAKELWTGVNNSIGEFVKKQADSRNAILAGWELFGGRTAMIESIKEAFQNLFDILRPVKEAFQSVFPPTTSETLLRMTTAFERLVDAMKPTENTINNIRTVAQGFFSALSIGWTIVKEGAKFITNLARSLLGLVAPEAVGFLTRLSQGLIALQDALVDGGKIKAFFDTLTRALQKPIEFLKRLKEAIADVFDGFKSDAADNVTGAVDRVQSRFEALKNFFSKFGDIWEPLQDALGKVGDILEKAWVSISGFFKEFGQRLANVMGPGDFDAVLDLINTGLFAGLIVILKKFFSEGLKIDLGGGFFEKASGIIDKLSGSLQAMQLNVKANAILKIAGAIAILTASVLVLSTIDSAALTKALGAMAVGFAELMASFSVFTKILATPAAAVSFTVMSVGLGLLATALLVMSGVMKVFSKMSWEEIGKGLTTMTGLLTILVGTAYGLGKAAGGMIAAGVGITALAIALTILTIPMKIFSKMSWGEIAKGLVTVAALLLAIGVALSAIPPTAPLIGAGIVAVAIAMNILAGAMKIFATMSWEEIGKGLTAMAGGLLLIGLALSAMPLTTPIIGAGLILVGIALVEIAGAMKIFGSMKWEEVGRGLTVLGGSMLILAVGLNAMSGAIPGALALLIAANALVVLAAVMKVLGKMDWSTVLDSLGKIAVTLLAFGLLAAILQPFTLAMLALGAALVVIGAGFVLAGAGAYLIAKALKTFVQVGDEAINMLGSLLEVAADRLPMLGKSLAKTIVGMVQVLAKAAPVFAKMLGKLLSNILDALIKLTPKLFVLIERLIDGLIQIIREKGPELIETGFFILQSLLDGVSNNIEQITATVAEIVVKFLDELSMQINGIVEAAVNLWVTFLKSVAYNLGKAIPEVTLGIAKAFVQGFLDGLEAEVPGLTTWFAELPGKILGWIGDILGTLVQKGKDLIQGLLNGIVEIFESVKSFITGIPGAIVDLIPNPLEVLLKVGKQIINGLKDGFEAAWKSVKEWVLDKVNWVIDQFKSMFGIFSPSRVMREIGMYVIEGFQNGMEDTWKDTADLVKKMDFTDDIDEDTMAKNFSDIMRRVFTTMDEIDQFSPTITPVLDLTQVREGAQRLASYLPAQVGYQHALALATQRVEDTAGPGGGSSGDVNFEQNIYAPKELSAKEIYKQTRNQISMAKEALSIP